MTRRFRLDPTNDKSCMFCNQSADIRWLVTDELTVAAICKPCREDLRNLLLLQHPLNIEELRDYTLCIQFREASEMFRRAADAEERRDQEYGSS